MKLTNGISESNNASIGRIRARAGARERGGVAVRGVSSPDRS